MLRGVSWAFQKWFLFICVKHHLNSMENMNRSDGILSNFQHKNSLAESTDDEHERFWRGSHLTQCVLVFYDSNDVLQEWFWCIIFQRAVIYSGWDFAAVVGCHLIWRLAVLSLIPHSPTPPIPSFLIFWNSLKKKIFMNYADTLKAQSSY